jgi:aminoglycoside phosphotransferase (APT) family kinase protein
MMELDPTIPVPPGEGILLHRLEEVLGSPVTVERFPSGHSNLTYLVKTKDKELVLRRPPPGAKAIKAGHDMEREYRLLVKLHPLYPRAPRPVHFEDGWYLMERVRGVILRSKPPEGFDLSAPAMKRISEAFLDNLVELHAVPVAKLEIGHPEGYVARQVAGWAERAKKSEVEPIPDMERAALWLAERIPAESGVSLVHNDYKYDNVVLDPQDLSRILAVLDWEMATVGDPLSDLGMTLAYWFEPGDPDEVRSLGIGLTALPGNLSREELVRRYSERSGRDASSIVFYYVLALFKVAVIAQQLHFRWKQGYTKDPRFAALLAATRVLARAAVSALERGSIRA